jgi:putative membrane-bound dehydrogenase-like protein
MELVAAEPVTTDPVAVAYDEDGRAYVAEMADYPYTDKEHYDADEEGHPTDRNIGRIRLMRDEDGDGRFERSTVFAAGLSWPTGVASWQGGVFVAATPDVWYFKDTDGDGKADIRKKILTGFRKSNVQSVINNPIWSLDHKIVFAGGSNGGTIHSLEEPDAQPVQLRQADFAYDPARRVLALESGGARFGNTFDDWGNRFLCNIRNPAQHVVLPRRYLTRNPYLPVSKALHDSADAGDALPVYRTSPVEPWREMRARRWVAENMNFPKSELIGAGVVTSSAGVTVYRGAAYPSAFKGSIFVADVASNLFYRLRVAPDGVTFRATRADEKVDFVTSDDTWFRPVNFANAPDGTLHVVDMYREVIEHPAAIPDDIHKAIDLEAGRDRGRIYRLAPPRFKLGRPPRLGRAATSELVAHLENESSWWRETAHRLIYERQDHTATPALRRMAHEGRSGLARAAALWSLAGLGDLEITDILGALADPSAGVREHAIRLGEARLASEPRLLAKIVRLARDPEIRVRVQAALSLGGATDARILVALANVARRNPEDPWVRTAVLTSAGSGAPLLLHLLSGKHRAFAASAAGASWCRQLASATGVRGDGTELNRVLAAIADDRVGVEAVYAVLLGTSEGLLRGQRKLGAVVEAASPTVRSKINRFLDRADVVAADAKAPLARRELAIELVGRHDFARAAKILDRVLDAREPQELQLAAVTTLARFSDAGVALQFLPRWMELSPRVRAEIIPALLAREDRIPPLLAAVKAGRIPATQISSAWRAALVHHRSDAIRVEAAKIFGDTTAAGRLAVITRYQAALDAPGDRTHGEDVYRKICSACHRAGEQGNDVGPNLSSVRGWSPEQILTNIIDPNREVAPNFVEYLVELKDGRTVSGLIASESAAAVTLKRADNVQESVLRREMAKMTSSGLSLMPEGLEAAIPPKDMADLLAFLRSVR